MFFSQDWIGDDNPRVIAKKRGADYVRWGLVGQAAAALLLCADEPSAQLIVCGVTLLALATPVLIVGCVRHAKHKHYPKFYGVIAGILSIAGVLILHCLPDRFAWTRRRKGFDVVMPKRVSTTWAPREEDLLENRPAARPVVNYMQNANVDDD
jgi:hypothetical protein